MAYPVICRTSSSVASVRRFSPRDRRAPAGWYHHEAAPFQAEENAADDLFWALAPFRGCLL
jgi:hypothetical protein